MSKSAARARAYPGSIRIIGGHWRGRKIRVAGGSHLRPTPARVRESLFNWLSPQIAGAACLDLFAGVGALGIEALSRGADRVVFVEKDAAIAAAITAHLNKFDPEGRYGRAQVETRSAEKYLATANEQAFDIVFLDAPYQRSLAPIIDRLPRFLAHDALIYAERAADSELPTISWARWFRRGRAGQVTYGLARTRH